MKTLPSIWLLAAALSLAACDAPGAAGDASGSATRAPAGKTLAAFASEAELRQTLTRLSKQRQDSVSLPDMPVAAAADAAAAPAEPTQQEAAPVSRADASADAITNVQTQGVDEGGIVKKQGDYLIVLRRGRLFTIRVGDDQLQPVSSIDAFAPQSDPSQTWYDEMLVSDGTVAVIGYSYDRGGTEIGLFDLGPQGQLSYRDTYQLRSNDYYSASNYASRLIGRTLVFYAPMSVTSEDPAQTLPALRRWHPGATPDEFKRILPAERIYRSPDPVDLFDATLHSVSLCDLDAPRMSCRSTAVFGPSSRSFYVSEDAVYVWTSSYHGQRPGKPNASVFRIPLDGGAPAALRASGAPVDQMSFLQRDGWLNVLVGSMSEGDGMWSSHSEVGDLALLRVRVDQFGDGGFSADRSAYRPLPEADLQQAQLHARFIGDWLVFGGGQSWGGQRAPPQAHALRYAAREAVQSLPLRHRVDRVDALGRDAVAIGARDGAESEGLHFTSLRLSAQAQVAGHYLQPQAAQGDQRTHGFFYRPDNADGGVLGLPILGADARGRAHASVLYLRNADLALSPIGTLDSKTAADIDDGCRVSCVDWYGNARPIFVGERVFALLGYELVEGRRDGGRIVERRRSNFSPRLVTAP
ncbi:beta-propeller domain-containing protein [Lysobacter sp. CA199]|uniref:beta-propeller domain-containing protein n=1 Tax=Lysobacter sp. CA199 TaxID=3455608 RepID=UPI003F8D10A0